MGWDKSPLALETEMWLLIPFYNYSTFLCFSLVNIYLASFNIKAFFSCNVKLIKLVSRTKLMAPLQPLIDFESYSNHDDTLEFFWKMYHSFYLGLVTNQSYVMISRFYDFSVILGPNS